MEKGLADGRIAGVSRCAYYGWPPCGNALAERPIGGEITYTVVSIVLKFSPHLTALPIAEPTPSIREAAETAVRNLIEITSRQ
jgi:hypothetical protein